MPHSNFKSPLAVSCHAAGRRDLDRDSVGRDHRFQIVMISFSQSVRPSRPLPRARPHSEVHWPQYAASGHDDLDARTTSTSSTTDRIGVARFRANGSHLKDPLRMSSGCRYRKAIIARNATEELEWGGSRALNERDPGPARARDVNDIEFQVESTGP